MSRYKYFEYACRSGKLDYKELGVYSYIWEYYNTKLGYAYPSRKQICDHIHISEPTLDRILKSLETKKFIKRERGNIRQNTKYYLLDTMNLDDTE